MNTPLAPFMPASGMIADKKKRVLLVDTSRTKRDLRSETLRKMGADVDCAADISEARVWWRPNLYNLVLIHGDTGKALTEKFCEDMRRVMPSQQIMFLVGKPDYLSISRNSDEPFASSDDSEDAYNKITAQVANNGAGSLPQSWGLLEACKRISTARSTANAKTRAMRDRVEPVRDSEVMRPGAAQASNNHSELRPDLRPDLETLLAEFREREVK